MVTGIKPSWTRLPAEVVTKNSDGKFEFHKDDAENLAKKIVKDHFDHRIKEHEVSITNQLVIEKQLPKPSKEMNFYEFVNDNCTSRESLAFFKQRQSILNSIPNSAPELSKKLVEKWEVQVKQANLEQEMQADYCRRISHIARVPFYLLGGAFLVAKTLLKAIVCIPVEIYNRAKGKVRDSTIGFYGVKEDLVMIGALAIKILGSCVKPKKGVSFQATCKLIFDVVIWEKDESLDSSRRVHKSISKQLSVIWKKTFKST